MIIIMKTFMHSCMNCIDFDNLMNQIDDQINSTRIIREQIKLLTLIPHHWSINKMSTELL